MPRVTDPPTTWPIPDRTSNTTIDRRWLRNSREVEPWSCAFASSTGSPKRGLAEHTRRALHPELGHHLVSKRDRFFVQKITDRTMRCGGSGGLAQRDDPPGLLARQHPALLERPDDPRRARSDLIGAPGIPGRRSTSGPTSSGQLDLTEKHPDDEELASACRRPPARSLTRSAGPEGRRPCELTRA